jgi:hypothetical protein
MFDFCLICEETCPYLTCEHTNHENNHNVKESPILKIINYLKLFKLFFFAVFLYLSFFDKTNSFWSFSLVSIIIIKIVLILLSFIKNKFLFLIKFPLLLIGLFISQHLIYSKDDGDSIKGYILLMITLIAL